MHVARKKKKKDFSNPRKLGFMRFLEIYWMLTVGFTVVALGFMDKSQVAMGELATFSQFAVTIVEAVGLWLMMRRKAFMRTWGMAYPFVMMLIILWGKVAVFGFTAEALNQTLGYLPWYVIVFVYFLTSRRVKAVMVEPLNMETRERALKDDTSFFAPKTWAFWRNLIMYFCVFSVVGHWMEAGYCLFIKWGLIPGIYDPNSQIWSDWLYPFCVYGVGAVCCVLLFYPVRLFLQHKIKTPVVPLVLSFIWNAFICSMIELAMGLILNQPDPVTGVMPLWDYRDMFCNFMGQICLQNALAFGFVSTLMTWLIYPALERLLAHLPESAAQMLFVVVVVFFLMLFFLYCQNFGVSLAGI